MLREARSSLADGLAAAVAVRLFGCGLTLRLLHRLLGGRLPLRVRAFSPRWLRRLFGLGLALRRLFGLGLALRRLLAWGWHCAGCLAWGWHCARLFGLGLALRRLFGLGLALRRLFEHAVCFTGCLTWGCRCGCCFAAGRAARGSSCAVCGCLGDRFTRGLAATLGSGFGAS